MKIEVQSATPGQKDVLRAAADAARECGVRAWLVGGPVRDAMLGRPILDLDLTLERDVTPFGEMLAERLGGRLSAFPSFLTVRISLPDGSELDVATTRSERYEKPGALPEVRPATLEEDLARRDFSINAMAMDLATGELADPWSGLEDLRSRRIRVLHERSFLDDPTRVFRGLRLAARLGFEFDATTLTLLEQAVKGPALETVSRERLWREWQLATEEDRPAAALGALADAGALRSLLPLREQPSRRIALDQVERIVLAEPRLDRVLLFLGALLPPDVEGLERITRGAGLSRRRMRALEQLVRAPQVLSALRSAEDAAGAIAILEGAPEELLAIAAADEGARPAAELYRRYRDLRLPFGGDELGLEGGPHLAAALRETRRALATGSLAPEEALTFARSRAMEYLHSGRER